MTGDHIARNRDGSRNEAAELQQSWEEQKKKLARYEKLLGDYSEMVRVAESKNKQLQEEKAEDHGRIQDLAKQAQFLDRQRREIADQLADMADIDDRRRQELEEYKREVRQLKRSHSDAVKKKQIAEEHIHRAEMAHKRLEDEGATDRKRLSSLRLEEKRLKKQVKEGEREIEKFQQKLANAMSRVAWLERDRRLCQKSWEHFEVEESRHNLVDENLMLKAYVSSAFELINNTEEVFKMMNGQLPIYQGAVDVEMIDMPPEAVSVEIPMPDAPEDRLESDIERILQSLDHGLSGGTGFELGGPTIFARSISSSPTSPTLPVPKFSNLGYLYQDNYSLSGPEPMDMTSDPALVQLEWAKMLKDSQLDETIFHFQEPPRKRPRWDEIDDSSDSDVQSEVSDLFGSVPDYESCTFSGRCDNSEEHRELAERLETGMNFSGSKRPHGEVSPKIKLHRPKQQLVDQQQRKMGPMPPSKQRVELSYPPVSSDLPTFATPATPQASGEVHKMVHTFRRVVQKTERNRLPGLWPLLVLVGIALVLLYLLYFIKSAVETRKWMEANEVPPNVMAALQRRHVSEVRWVQALDYRIGQLLDIDRVALG